MTDPDRSPSIATQFSYNSLYVNPLNDDANAKHDSSSTEGSASALENRLTDNKENVTPNKKKKVPVLADKENSAPTPTNGSSAILKPTSHLKRLSSGKVLEYH